jgi:hypothetical protein
MKIAITVVVISSFIFFTALKMLDEESDKYKNHIETNQNEALTSAL